MNNYPNGPQQPYQHPSTGPYPPNGYPSNPGYPQQPSGPMSQPGYPPPVYHPIPPQQEPHKKKSRKGLYIGLGIIVGVVVLCGIFASGFHSTSSNTGTVSTNTNAASQPGAHLSQHFKVGDTVKVGTTWQVVVNSVKTDDGGQFSALKTGDTYLVADISLTNLSNQEQNVSSIIDFTLQDSTGKKYDESIDGNAGATLDGKVEAGQPLRGVIAWEVQQSAHNFTLNFSPDLVSSGQTTWDVSV